MGSRYARHASKDKNLKDISRALKSLQVRDELVEANGRDSESASNKHGVFKLNVGFSGTAAALLGLQRKCCKAMGWTSK